MSEHFEETIAHLQKKLSGQEEQVSDTKRLINMLCKEAGMSLMYPTGELAASSISSIRSDLFYGRPLASTMREFLQMRHAANLGAATNVEIHNGLKAGGYKFNAKNVENERRTVQLGLSKNQIFHRVPNGSWGLSEWYPKAKSDRNGKASNSDSTDNSNGDAAVATSTASSSDAKGGESDG